jgi:DNA-binding NarL/FixJ family response regulator
VEGSEINRRVRSLELLERSHHLTVLGDLLATVLETGQGRLVLLRGEGREDRFRDRGARRIPRGPRPSTRQNRAGLTSRELDVITLLAPGWRNSEIAERLVVSERTVDHHVSPILGSSTFAHAVRRARRLCGSG